MVRVLINNQAGSDKALGGAMMLAAAVVLTYYTIWALLLVCIRLDPME